MKKMKKLLAWLMLLTMVTSCIPCYAAEAAEEGVVINAADFGADPSGETDSTEAIWNALQAAKEAEAGGTSVTLEFPKGEYHIYEDKTQVREYHTSNTNSIENPQKRIGILVEEHENLTIDGNGSLFMIHGKMMALAVVKSKNITLRDFSWDFAVPTVIEMTVSAVGSNYTDYYIPDCFPHTVSGTTIRWSSDLSPYTGQPYWSGSGHQPDGNGTYAVVGYHPSDEMARNYYPSDGPLANVSSITELDDNNVRVYYSSRTGAQSSNQKVGNVFELCGNAHREMAGAYTWESENVLAEYVNVHFMHGFGWLIQMSKDVFYKHCNLAPRKDSGHVTVSFADGIHASGAAGQLLFEDCNFANTHDDPLNLHGTFTRVESRRDDYTLTLKYIHAQQGGFTQYHVGDKVQFFTRDTLESTDGESMYTVAEVIQDAMESSDKRTMIIRFEEALPANLSDRIGSQPKYVAENVTYAPAVTVRNCTFKNVATRGILCTTRNKVLIENNVFHNMSMATIFLSNDSNEWYESGPIRDMTIRNNIFHIKDIGRTAWATAPAIYVHPVTLGNKLPDASNPIHKNITIEGNTFFMDLDRVVEAESVENFTFKNNKVFRMNPDVEIEIGLADTSLEAGETAALTVNSNGNTNNGSIDNLFQFKACKNVVIEGNTYDDGLKLCAVVDTATRNNGITVNDEEIAVVNSATAVASPVTDIQYASSDASVATVDENGAITAVAAGTAKVFAYYEWNGTMIRSNAVEVTVEGNGTSAEGGNVTIVKADGSAADNAEVNMKEAATVQFAEADGKEVTWSVVDFETEGATDKATIAADGTLTAAKEGVVWVKAATADGASDRAAVVIYGGEGYGLNSAFEIRRENTATRTINSDSFEIISESGDLYNQTNTLKNLFLYTPSVDRSNLRASVKVDGLPIREGGKWDTASFILLAGEDDYYTIGKKSHFNGFATVKERAQSAAEAHGDSAHDAVSSAWLGIVKTGDEIKLEYSLDGTTWATAKTFTDATFGNDYKLGFGTWTSSNTQRKATFSEFKVGTADQSYAELEAVSILKTDNERPSAADLAVSTSGTTATAAYTFADADGDNEGASLYRWTYEENGVETTEVTTSNSINAAGVSAITCQVYPVDAYGTPGTPSAAASASFGVEDTAELYSVAFGGKVVYERNGEKDVTVRLPEEVEKINMTYVSVNNVVGDVEISKNGTALEGDYSNSDSVMLDVADGDVIVITRGGETYTFTIELVASDVTEVTEIAVDVVNFKVDPSTEQAFFLGTTAKKAGTIKVTVAEEVGAVKILDGYLREELEVTADGNAYAANYTLIEGVNSFYIQVVAKDGITTQQYILNVIYDAPAAPTVKLNDTKADNLKVGAAVTDIYVATVEENTDYTFELCEGNGDTHNDYFRIVDNQLKIRKALTDGQSYMIRVKAVSETSVLEATFTITAEKVRTDYPVNQLTAISESEYLPGTANEGPDDFILDGNTGTHWHTNWNTSEAQNVAKRWVGVSLPELTKIDGIRYHSRGGNGDVTTYRIEYRTTDNGEWTTLTTGTWARGAEWRVVTFPEIAVKQIRVVGVHTYADSGNDAHMSCAEFRVTVPTADAAADKDALQQTIAAAEALEADKYTEESWAALEEALAYANEINEADAIQEAVDEAEEALQKAIDELEAAAVEPEIPDTEVCKIFTDVAHGAWYEGAVQYVYDAELILGNEGLFSPDADTTRAMVATILYRMEGSPAVSDYTKYNQFSDVAAVEENAWYTDAIAWALNTGVATGDDENMLYNPNAAVTREQLATFLYRYAAFKGADVTVEGEEADLFGDTYVSEWAKVGFAWAVENELIKGSEATDADGNIYADLNPQGGASRAQFATVLQRYLSK